MILSFRKSCTVELCV
uniref:Uncharacterized protein n=1 Tax=Anguilla anguilla TaxID=7936 RepID=A0A0E9UC08_ANGAN